MQNPTDEQIEFVAEAIRTQSVNEAFFDKITEEVAARSEYELTENDFEHFQWGFVWGFIYCLKGMESFVGKSKKENHSAANTMADKKI